jgi:hypothetical protein
MEPTQTRSPRAQIKGKRKASEDDLGVGQQAITVFARTGPRLTLAEIALDGPLRPRVCDFDVEPSTRIEHVDTRVDRCDTDQYFVARGHDH